MSSQRSNLFAERTRTVQASSIREICRLIAQPDVISLAGGWPHPDTFPAADTARIVADLMRERPGEVLQYGLSEGLQPLRLWLRNWLHAREDIDAEADEMVLVTGSQMGMDLTARVFIDKGDVAIVGLPTYFGGTGALQTYGAELVGVREDDDGLDTDQLAATLERLRGEGKRVKVAYVQPTFHNPLGVTMSEPRRRRLLELAEEHDFVIAEDNPYADLRYEGEPVPPLKSMDRGGRVVYMKSFSKIYSPGLRLAVVVADEEVVRRMVIARQYIDCCPPMLSQYLLFEFARSGLLDRKIAENVRFYRAKRDRMLQAVAEHVPAEVTYTRPQGGFFTFLTLPRGLDGAEVLKDSLLERVAFVPGAQFFVDGSGSNTIRLSFAQAPDNLAAEGVGRLGALLGRLLAATR